jgi:hypothetical protein
LGEAGEEEGDGELSDPRGEDEDEICCVDGLEKRSATGVGMRLTGRCDEKTVRLATDLVYD